MEVDDHGLIYREREKSDCVAIVPGTMPEQIKLACAGRSLGDFVDLGKAALLLADITIVGRLESWEGPTAFALTPEWIRAAR